MAQQDFEAIWVPRIGEDATAALGRWRRRSIIRCPCGLLLACAASFAFGEGILGDLLGAVLLASGMYLGAATIYRGQREIAAALSRRLEVTIRAGELPPMTPKRFDRWRTEREQGTQRRLKIGPVKIVLPARGKASDRRSGSEWDRPL